MRLSYQQEKIYVQHDLDLRSNKIVWGQVIYYSTRFDERNIMVIEAFSYLNHIKNYTRETILVIIDHFVAWGSQDA